MTQGLVRTAEETTPIIPLITDQLSDWLAHEPAATQHWVRAHNFKADADTFLVVPDDEGNVRYVLAGVKEPLHIWSLAYLPLQLPAGTYAIQADWDAQTLQEVAIGWGLACYQFDRYKKMDAPAALLKLDDAVDADHIFRVTDAIYLTRELVNVPAEDMGPSHLAVVAKEVADTCGAEYREVVGDDLLKENYPAIHAVGRAAANKPRLIDLRWGNPEHPKLTLVGKGVCFDTGGLDIKPYSSMKLMKKDMGGAALMLGLAQLIMQSKLPVRLRLLIPAVENNIDSNAFRPQDILSTRKGLTIEVGSTDAEGRLILADALAEADEEKPDLLIDAATLTGAARVALGAELPALFANDDATAMEIQQTSMDVFDALWRLPLWEVYEENIDSPVADVANSPSTSFGGAIHAALFLQRFVEHAAAWVHIDTMAWNLKARPGRPAGGEAFGLRALYTMLAERFKG